MSAMRLATALTVVVVLCMDRAWADEGGLEVATESQQEFTDIMNNLKQNSFVDTTMDADLGRSLRDNLRGKAGKPGKQGIRGLTGPRGNTGPVGPAGPRGKKGAQGQPGPRGPQGPRGVVGRKGPPGAMGPMGPTGPRGFQGVTGPKGDQGQAGPPGPVGATGKPGFKGPHGKTGPRGYKGAQGPIGYPGLQGPSGPSGKPGPAGPRGATGATGVQGRPGKRGVKGDTGPKGPKGSQGNTGAQGRRGLPGTRGKDGSTGKAGPQGARGATGAQGKRGEQGPRGVKGDQGPRGGPGATGAQGPQGARGMRGMPGPAGAAGPPGSVGNAGKPGAKGPRGATGPKGPLGQRGPKGNDGSLRKYTLTGKRRFMLAGGANANAAAKIYSGQENNGPVLFFETNKSPVSLAMYQTKRRQSVASINGYYGNIGIGEKMPQAKLHVKGQILMSHNFNNVLVSKEKRKVGKSMKTTQFDLIGTYWGMDKKAVYIGAFTGPAKPGNHAEKVIFGGSTNEKAGKASVDLATGKVSAKGFVTTRLPTSEDESMSDLDAESLLQVSDSDEDVAVDLGQSHHYLHKKVRQQAATIAKLKEQLNKMSKQFKTLKGMFEA